MALNEPRVFLDGRVILHGGDCLTVLDALPENSVDAVVTDPPYHLTSVVKRFGSDGAAPARANGATGIYKRASAGFMGKQWDGGDVAFKIGTWMRVMRVLKPGGYILAFASTRGFGRMSVAIEEAGFVTHPMIAWIFGSGFPKATRVKAEGYDGWRYGGQALKPAIEPIYMGQKPFSEVNGTANILRWGTGAINIDGCRVAVDPVADASQLRSMTRNVRENEDGWGMSSIKGDMPQVVRADGRWPANIIHDGSDEVVEAFPDSNGQQGDLTGQSGDRKSNGIYGDFPAPREALARDEDEASAARFFYSAKADAEDRLGSQHPTVKPLDLIQYLCRLVTPPRVLDCPQCDMLAYGKSTEKTSPDSPVRVVPDAVQAEGQPAHGQVLQPSVRSGGSGSSEEDVRMVRDGVSAPEGRRASVLQPDLRQSGNVGEQGLNEGLRPQQGGLQAALDAGPSAIPFTEGLHLRAPLGDAAEDWQAADEGRSGPPHKRHQDGQPAGEPSVDAEGGPRQIEPASAEHPVLPPLSGEDRHQPTCTRCGHRLEYRPGRVLDPFAGTGTTGEAAWREGLKSILIEREVEYQDDIARRMDLAMKPTKRSAVAKTKNNLMGAEGTPLFGPGTA